ncbi:MAG TPA: acyl-CoA synthetase [Acidimicrobiales bacterium]|nr:acyl-CoA synthetase [Acidimicrobiales bacterium]
MSSYNLSELFEIVVDHCPDREAIVADERRLTYAQLDERSNRLAHHLASLGVGPGDFVGLQMVNGTEYMEGMLACFKLRAVPVNVNYRYVEAELRYLFDDADLVALLVHQEFADRARAAAPPSLKHIIVVEDDYEDALAAASPERDFDGRTSDDIYVVYTGGTTGMPKGVLWRHEDIFKAALGGGDVFQTGNFIKTPEELPSRIPDPGMTTLPTPPLMHSSAAWLAFSTIYGGGKMVLAPQGRFDPGTILRLIGDEGVNTVVVVGDAMARPLMDAYEEKPDAYDTSSLIVIGSGGAILSSANKVRLSELFPNVMVVDGFGSSETGTLGSKATMQGSADSGPRFSVNEQTLVLDDDMKPVVPGSGVTGRLARHGHIPLGYHKDPEKTAKTFVEYDGRRYVLPGDMALVEEDGTVVLLGRGSGSINTGGEKVFPEEVEAALKAHADVVDAVVVGLPDERWGERVVAVVQPRPGAEPTLEELQAFSREHIAGYKVPRAVCIVEQMVRSPSGKADYRWAKQFAADAVG